MKKFLSLSGTYLIPYIGGIWFGMLLVIAFSIPFRFITGTNLLADRIFRAIVLIAGTSGFMYFAMKKQGYKAGEFQPRKMLYVCAAIFVVHHLVILAIDGYVDHFTGGARSICEAIWLGGESAFYTDNLPEGVPIWSYHLAMFILNVFVYLPISLLGQKNGAKKRISERKELGLTDND